MSRISDEELRQWIASAYPAPWDFSEVLSDDGHEWYGCGVSSGTGHEFVWLEEGPETDNPTARLIALAPALAIEVLELREERRSATYQKISGLIEWLQQDPDYIYLLPADGVAKLREWVDAALSTPSPVVAKEGRDA